MHQKQKQLHIEEILQTVTASGCLGNSKRQKSLLKYILHENRAHRGNRIKAYSIALDVFGREDDFDNSKDSIVRVEMHKLRKNLTIFNAQPHIFKLDIPKATYLINIEEIDSTSHFTSLIQQITRPPLLFATGLGVSILSGLLIWKFASVNTSNYTARAKIQCSHTLPNVALFSTQIVGNTLEETTHLLIDNTLRTSLAQYAMVNIVTQNADCSKIGTPFYTVKPSVLANTNAPYISIVTQENKNNSIIWSYKLQLSQDQKTITQKNTWELYNTSALIAYTTGIIPKHAAVQKWGDRDAKQIYSCHALARDYYISRERDDTYWPAVNCLQAVIKEGNENPDILGLLAAFYLTQPHGKQPQYTDTPIESAEQLIKRSEDINQFNPTTLAAKLRLETGKTPRNIEEIRHAARALDRMQPYNPNALNITSQVSGFILGDWEYAKRSSDLLLNINHSSRQRYHYVELAYALLHASPEQAYHTSQSVYDPTSRLSLLMCLAAANNYGQVDKAIQYKKDLEKMNMNSVDDYIVALKQRNSHTSFVTKMTELLRENPNERARYYMQESKKN